MHGPVLVHDLRVVSAADVLVDDHHHERSASCLPHPSALEERAKRTPVAHLALEHAAVELDLVLLVPRRRHIALARPIPTRRRKEREGVSVRERKRERECVCVCLCVYVFVCSTYVQEA